MEMDEDLSAIETSLKENCSESFGDISCITTEDGKTTEVPHTIESDMSADESSMLEESINSFYDPAVHLEISDILGIVGKKWSIFHVSPLWNFNFDKDYLHYLCQHLKKVLMQHIITNLKNKFSQIDVKIEAKEAYNELVALKIEIIDTEANTTIYTGLLLKSHNYTEYLKKTNLSHMPILLSQGNISIAMAIQNWLINTFDCVIQPFEFALHQFLWLVTLSLGDAGQFYNEIVLYHYLYKYELSKGEMDVKCYIESEFLRSILAKLLLNRSSSEATSFHYSDLIKVQTEIEDHFKVTSGINVSKLKLKIFEAPKVASINVSGKILIRSSSLMDLILKYLMEPENDKCMP